MRLKPTYSPIYTLLQYCFYCLLLASGPAAMAQSNVEVFGQNRIQHRKFAWKFFDTKHFRVYHYDKAGRTLGRYVAEEAENNISVIEQKMGGEFPSRFNIVLYNSYDEYRQTNIGLRDESQLALMTKPVSWNLAGDKLVLYYTGKHTDLRHQVQAGMAQVVMQRMIYGENFKKMLKTSLLLNLPPWVTQGFISYLVDGWNTEANSEWKRLLDADTNKGFYEWSDEYPELAGKAFWKFVDDNYGMNKMKALLAALEQKTSLNKAMKDKQHLGMKVTKVYDSCMQYYKSIYEQDMQQQEVPDSTRGLISLKVPKDNSILRNVLVSPRGTDIAFVAWNHGQYQVITQKTAKDQVQSVLMEGGQKDMTDEIDPHYPLICWSPSGHKLAILYKKDNKTKLKIYNNAKGKIENYVIPPNRFDRVLGMSFMDDDNRLIFSAIRKSQSDLYMFTIKGSKMTNITDDEWDDIDPVFVSGGSRTGILFLSNRTKPNITVPLKVNELPNGPMNVFFYNTKSNRPELLQCSKIKDGTIHQPIQYGTDHFAFLYDANGISNNYVVMFNRDENNMDTAYAVPMTNYYTSIISHQYNAAVDEVADVVQVKDKYRVYFHPLVIPNDTILPKVLKPTTLSISKRIDTLPTSLFKTIQYEQPANNSTISSLPTVKSGSAFQSEFDDEQSKPLTTKATADTVVTTAVPEPKAIAKTKADANLALAEGDSSVLAVISDSAYIKMKPNNYKANFKQDLMNFRADNTILFTQYQSYANNGGQYKNPDMGLLTTYSIGELLEDKKILVGFQLPMDLSSSTYFAQYQNNRRMLDWGILGYRTQNKETGYVQYTDQNGVPLFTVEQLFKRVTNLLQFDVKYPFDRRRSLRIHTAIRQDNLIEKAQDTLSLKYELPNTNLFWSLSKMEYVFDNTINPMLNIRLGTRYKLYAEYMNQVNGEKQSCYNFGLDFRTYTKVFRHSIWATRVAYAHSDGTSKVEYQIGGVDNWIKPQVAQGGQSADGYGFIALATSMRGYLQAARKGNNFALLSTEYRLPVCATFVKRPVQSATLNNLQVVAFVDAGSAWRGFMPDADNSSITYTFPQLGYPSSGNNNVAATISIPSTSGFMMGYGMGIRTTLLGYFLRCDAAWNLEGSPKPQVYVGIGTDF